ncbi:hypothetical protein [Aureispira anguillae]|uniref:Uncharacterized protein n=1 Tax=Aureispira anguillae TaxID=2864201 RepID=A0A916DWS9_9BACT|nr:hypothetical protein [Aureispira anguillae]BDS15025.1 hypothetical protein AsAng_0058070 [Aureispira anguillae]
MKETPFFEFEEFGENETPPARWKSVLSIVIIVIMALLLFRLLLALVVPIITLILLIANRDLVSKIARTIYQLYQNELYKGLLATLAAIFLFAPFVIFLFFRTVYYMFVEEKPIINNIREGEENESELINIVIKEKMKNLLRDDDNNYR